jgi:adenine-specific DNA-methyltransferase
MDEIFNKDNFLNDIIWNSTKSVTNTALISVSHTHNLVYFKRIEYFIQNRIAFRLKEDGDGFDNPDNDPRGVWKADPFQVGGWRPNQQYEITNPNTGVVYKPNDGCSWKNEKKVFDELLKDNRIVFGTTGESGPQRKRFLTEAIERGKVAKTIWDDIGTTTNGTQHLKDLFKDNVFSNPKPESLIERIIEISTRSGDLVLDYHLGSGTTAAVAHKMGRQYIGVEQMDYIETVSVERLKKVIAGEQGGISKSVKWQGGGDFVYCKLANDAEEFRQAALTASANELNDLFEKAKHSSFLSYRIDTAQFNDFDTLTEQEKRELLCQLVDANTLYVNYADIDSKDYDMSEEDKKLNRQFYGDK